MKKGIQSGVDFDVDEGILDTPEQRQVLRKAAQDAVVLLKNDKKLLPLSNQLKKIAVIGPNAATAMTSGGGSARLLSTYAISPLEGIRAAVKGSGTQVTYTIGATTHKYLPVLNALIQHDTGRALVEFWNDKPSSDFIDTAPNFTTSLTSPTWTTPTQSTECFLADHIVGLFKYQLAHSD